MATFLSPGVFITEVDSPVQGIEGVSTSNMGIVGWTLKGPAPERLPRLVTSFEQFNREFGGFTADSLLPNLVSAFFSNGGRRAYIQRVVPADAVKSEGKITSSREDVEIETGDGSTTNFAKTAATTPLQVNSEASPLVPGSTAFRWRSSSVAVTNRITYQISSSSPLTADGASSLFTGRIRTTTARGSIQALTATPATLDAESFDLDDGTNPAVTFEFDNNASVTETNTLRQVDVTAVGTVQAAAIAMRDAINSAPALNIYAEILSAADDTVVLHQLTPGTAGDTPITETSGGVEIAVTSFSGGAAEISVDEHQFLVDPSAAVGITYDNGTTATTVSCATRIDRWTYASAATPPAATSDYAIIDLRTGVFSLRVGSGSTATADTAITANFTSLLDRSATDNESGVLTGDVTGASPTNLINYDTGEYDITVVGGTAATGSITTVDEAALTAATSSGTTFTLDDGIHPAVTYQLNINGANPVSPETPTLREVTIATADTADDVRDAIITAVTNTPVLSISAASGGAGLVSLTHGLAGEVGNVTITETVPAAGFIVAGMSGGVDNDIPHNSATSSEGAPLLLDYDIHAWELLPVSEGAWGDGLRLLVQGNADSFTPSTGLYTAWDIFVQLYNSTTGGYDTLETYEAVDFSDPTSAQYFPNVLNDASDQIRVTEPGADEEPQELLTSVQTRTISGGDATTAGKTIIVTLGETPIHPRSVTISYTDSTSTARTITDDGSGNLTGSVDGSGTNTITYSSGVINVTTANLIAQDTLVTVSYRKAASASDTTDFGDTTQLKSDGAGSGAALPTVSGSTALVAGSNGTFDDTNYGSAQVSSASLKATSSGVYGLNKVDEIMQVVVPDFAGDITITGELIDYVEDRALQPQGADRFLLLAPPEGSDPSEASDWVRVDLNRYSRFAALYAPWIEVSNPLQNNRPLLVPPMGHIAGIYARTDNNRNVSKAPAGVNDGQLLGLRGLEFDWTQDERDIVYPNKINPLISEAATGLAVWGARTMSMDSSWRYINVARLFQFVEKSIWRATQWVVFEPNDAETRLRVKGQLDAFLGRLYAQRYFAGATPSQAFSVICDESNNPPETVDAGQLIVDVAIAPLKPAEFIVYRIAQKSVTNA